MQHFARSQSDFVTNLKVFASWEAAVSLGRQEEEAFCARFGVNAAAMRTAQELRRRFRRVARDVGLEGTLQTETDRKGRNNLPTGEPRAEATLIHYAGS